MSRRTKNQVFCLVSAAISISLAAMFVVRLNDSNYVLAVIDFIGSTAWAFIAYFKSIEIYNEPRD